MNFSKHFMMSIATCALGACSSARSQVAVAPHTAPTQPMRPPDGPPPRVPVRLVEMRNEASTRVSFRFVLQGGSADDPTGKAGLTRLMTRLMVEGGTQALTFEQLTRRLFPMAAEIQFQIDRDYTVITGEAHRDHVTEFYPLLRDVIIAPRFADEDFRRVKTQSLADLRLDLRGSSDETLGKELLQSLVYDNHPYGHPALGTERGLDAITLDDVRAQHRGLFCTSRLTVGLAGAYPAALADTIRTDLTALAERCNDPVRAPSVERPHGMHVVIVDKPAASSTALSVGFPTTVTRRDPDFAAVQFATNYLGLHRQSVGVLFQTLREARGLNYGDYAYAEHFEQAEGSRFPRPNVLRQQQYVSLWVRPVPARYAHFALRAAVRALDRTVREGIAQADLDRVRGFLDGYVGLYTQTESERLGYAIDDVFTGNAQGTWLTRTREAWAALTPETLQAAVQRDLTAQDLWVAIVAPNAQELAAAIGSNAPSPITYDTPKAASVMAEDREISVFPLPVRPADVRVMPLAEVFR